MKELGGRTLANTEHLHKDWILIKEYPLSERLLAMVARLALTEWDRLCNRCKRCSGSHR